jgi:predicted ATPase
MTHDKSPGAARNSVTDRLKTAAKDSPWTLADLQRQYAYDRLVERLYRLDPDWIIKGATALLVRRVSVREPAYALCSSEASSFTRARNSRGLTPFTALNCREK